MANARVIGKHQTTDAVTCLDIRRFLGQRHLNAGRTPFDKVRQFALTDALQTLVHLGWIDLPCNLPFSSTDKRNGIDLV